MSGLPVAESKPVRLLGAVAAGATAATAGLAIIPGVPGWVAGVVGLVGLVLTAGLSRYTEGVVTPTENVAAVRDDKTGATVAGPASVVPDGVKVDVTTAGPGDYFPPPAEATV